MQKLRYSRYFKSAIIILDILIVAAVFVFFFLMRHEYVLEKSKNRGKRFVTSVIKSFWILLMEEQNCIPFPRNLTYTLLCRANCYSYFHLLLGIVLLARVSNNEFLKYERFWITFTLFIILFIVKSFIFFTLKYIRAQGGNYRNVMFIAENSSSEILKILLPNVKIMVIEFMNFPMKKLTFQSFKILERKRNSYRFYSYSKII